MTTTGHMKLVDESLRRELVFEVNTLLACLVTDVRQAEVFGILGRQATMPVLEARARQIVDLVVHKVEMGKADNSMSESPKSQPERSY